MAGPLDGTRVLDFTERIQGPYGTQILADLGAEVIKVERITSLTPDGRPDDRYPHDRPPSLYTSMFLSANRNKKSIAVDLKSDSGKNVVHRLLAGCDVVYENFRPGVMERLGFGYDACRRSNAAIIYASASGYGPSGPYMRKPGQDVLVQALSGIGAINVSGAGRPTPVGMSITDVMGGMNGAIAVLAAIYHRERTGEGQHVHVSLLAGAIAAQSMQAVQFLNSQVGEPERKSTMHGHPYIRAPYGFYATRDSYLAIGEPAQVWRLCEILGIDLEGDRRFNSAEKRENNRREFEELLENALRGRSTAEWLQVLEASEIEAAPVNTFASAFSDPQVQHQHMVTEVESPIGRLRLPAPPYRLSATPAKVHSAPPRHGEHTDELLASVGFDDEVIAELRSQEVVA